MRSIWKGHIRFSLVTIPVRVYNALDTAQTIHFNQLHRECNGPIGYDKRCKKCAQQVSNADIVKGFQHQPEQYVIIEASDLDKLKLESTKIIEIQGFAEASEIDATLYEAPYFAGPDGPVAAQAYALLREALRESGRVGVGKVVLRDREDVVIIAPHGRGLVLYKLRYPSEVRSVQEVPQLDSERELDREQLKLARHLVDTMATPFADLELKDTYNDALRDLIEAKIAGQEIVAYSVPEQPVVDIMTALKASIEQARASREPMIKASGKGRKAAAEPPESARPETRPAAAAKPAKRRKPA